LIDLHQAFVAGDPNGKKLNLTDLKAERFRFDQVSLVRAILRRADLSDSSCLETDFTEAELCFAVFSWANLKGATFRRADLRGANFAMANLSGATLECADLRSAVPDSAISDLADPEPGAGFDATDPGASRQRGDDNDVLEACDSLLQTERDVSSPAQPVNLAGATLDNANFSGSRMRGAVLAAASVKGADFSYCDLSGANLRRVDISEAILTETNLDGAMTLQNGVGLPDRVAELIRQHNRWIVSDGMVGRRADFTGMNLRGIDFVGCDLRGSDFTRADLGGARFDHADLMLTSFAGANLVGASFTGAMLRGTIFSGARLENARFLAARLDVAEILNAQNERTGKTFPVIFREADLNGADFRRAKISREIFLQCMQHNKTWAGSKIDLSTELVG
jgi:uncharacterized protein YjbI with pentapeptide repeats